MTREESCPCFRQEIFFYGTKISHWAQWWTKVKQHSEYTLCACMENLHGHFEEKGSLHKKKSRLEVSDLNNSNLDHLKTFLFVNKTQSSSSFGSKHQNKKQWGQHTPSSTLCGWWAGVWKADGWKLTINNDKATHSHLINIYSIFLYISLVLDTLKYSVQSFKLM